MDILWRVLVCYCAVSVFESRYVFTGSPELFLNGMWPSIYLKKMTFFLLCKQYVTGSIDLFEKRSFSDLLPDDLLKPVCPSIRPYVHIFFV